MISVAQYTDNTAFISAVCQQSFPIPCDTMHWHN